MNVKDFLSSLAERFVKKETTTLASSLAFYFALSMAPLLILFITLSSKLSLSLQQAFYNQAAQVAGSSGADTVRLIIENAKDRPDLATISGFFGVITLLLSASLIFGEMKSAFNKIFDCKPPPPVHASLPRQIWLFVESRILHIGLALCCIFIMIASLLVSSAIAAALSSHQTLWRNLNLVISFLFYIGLFSLIFRSLPDIRIAWKNAFRGGVITALLFVVGKELIAFYLGHSAIGSAYGVAGSVILLLVWVYYSTLIIFVGAHVSSLLANTRDLRRKAFSQGHPLPAR
jgi:membrane protein